MELLRWFVSASACDRDRSQSVLRTTWHQQSEFKSFPPNLPKVLLPSLEDCADAEAQHLLQPLVASLCRAHVVTYSCGAAASASVTALPLTHISLLLRLSFGITGDRSYQRAAPSSGGLCPSELFIFWDNAPYHFCPRAVSLTQLHPKNAARTAALNMLLPVARPSSCTLFIVCNLHRTGVKYGDRCFRYVAADVGHIVENLRLVALALGLNCIVESVFDDVQAASFLGVDGVNEVVVGVATISHPAFATAADAPASSVFGCVSALAAGQFDVCSVPPRGSAPLGVTGVAHTISSFRRTANPSTMPSSQAQPPRRPSAAPSHNSADCFSLRADETFVTLPPPACAPASIFHCILSRRSYRKHVPGAVPLDALHAMLLSILTPFHCVSASVRLHIIISRAGIDPGLYRAVASPPTRDRIHLHRVKSGSFAAAAQEAALDQDIIGNAAIVLIFSLSCACIADAGAAAGREYRNGYIEAGAPQTLCACALQPSHIGQE
jgi:SagB-type dehydrogenase family enzyme